MLCSFFERILGGILGKMLSGILKKGLGKIVKNDRPGFEKTLGSISKKHSSGFMQYSGRMLYGLYFHNY